MFGLMRVGWLIAFAVCCGFAWGDDAAIAWGGNPKALNGHPSVRMENEKIKLTIGRKFTTVTCAFVFVCDGRACKVRMGFPDEGEGSYDTEMDEFISKKKAFTAMKYFRSYVDGRRVPTRLIQGPDPKSPMSWHEKVVPFDHGQTHFILDEYRVPTGESETADGTFIGLARYTMSTGASWKGTIGKATVLAQFDKHLLPGRLTLEPVRKLKIQDPDKYDKWAKLKPGMVVFKGFGRPTLNGRNVLFVAKDLKPTKRSDINLGFVLNRVKR